jgi:uncharacterized membrane protein HdeD (DUF308 family)
MHMRTWVLVSGLVGIVIGIVALALGLYGFKPSVVFDAVGAVIMAAGAAASGYAFGERTSVTTKVTTK